MKVFKMNENDYVAAESWKKAKEWYLEFTGFSEEYLGEKKKVNTKDNTMFVEYTKRVGDFILKNSIETIIKGWRGMLCVKLTFKQVLELEEANDEEQGPFIIASTEI